MDRGELILITRVCNFHSASHLLFCQCQSPHSPNCPGAINFCLDQIDLDDNGEASESVTDDNVDVAIHEAAHVLGMSSNSYRFFWDPDTGLEPRQAIKCVLGKNVF